MHRTGVAVHFAFCNPPIPPIALGWLGAAIFGALEYLADRSSVTMPLHGTPVTPTSPVLSANLLVAMAPEVCVADGDLCRSVAVRRCRKGPMCIYCHRWLGRYAQAIRCPPRALSFLTKRARSHFVLGLQPPALPSEIWRCVLEFMRRHELAAAL